MVIRHGTRQHSRSPTLHGRHGHSPTWHGRHDPSPTRRSRHGRFPASHPRPSKRRLLSIWENSSCVHAATAITLWLSHHLVSTYVVRTEMPLKLVVVECLITSVKNVKAVEEREQVKKEKEKQKEEHKIKMEKKRKKRACRESTVN